MERHPIARWLVESRTAQINPATKRPWSQDYFLARLEAETGWTPFRSNYSKYENGKLTPRSETLARFVEFWKRHGVAAPDLTPPVAEPTEQGDPLIAILTRQVLAIESLVAEMRESREREQDMASAVLAAVAALGRGPTRGGSGASTANGALSG